MWVRCNFEISVNNFHVGPQVKMQIAAKLKATMQKVMQKIMHMIYSEATVIPDTDPDEG